MLGLLQERQNHVVYLFDESDSMRPHSSALTTLFDNEIKFLAQQSIAQNQETRVSVYLFSSRGTARCILYDQDVLRTQESFTLRGLYNPHGMTALCDGTVMSIEELDGVKHPHGQHSKWLIAFTDGFENASTTANKAKMPVLLGGLPDEWTVSIFVPDQISKRYARDYGFPSDNIAIWDTTSVRGVEEAGKAIRKASESYFTMRSTGGKGSKSLFTMNPVSTDAIKRNLVPMSSSHYSVVQHPKSEKDTIWIRDIVNDNLPITYKRGYGYYELVKNEHIKPHKAVVIEQGGQFFAGNARDLLGLPDEEVKVGPDHNPSYKIFVQSDSHNRNIIPGQRVLYIHGQGPLTHMRTY